MSFDAMKPPSSMMKESLELDGEVQKRIAQETIDHATGRFQAMARPVVARPNTASASTTTTASLNTKFTSLKRARSANHPKPFPSSDSVVLHVSHAPMPSDDFFFPTTPIPQPMQPTQPTQEPIPIHAQETQTQPIQTPIQTQETPKTEEHKNKKSCLSLASIVQMTASSSIVKPQNDATPIRWTPSQQNTLEQLVVWARSVTDLAPALLCGPCGSGKTAMVMKGLSSQGFKVVDGRRSMADATAEYVSKSVHLRMMTADEKTILFIDELESMTIPEREGLLSVLRQRKSNEKFKRIHLLLSCQDPWEPNMKVFREGACMIKAKPLTSQDAASIIHAHTPSLGVKARDFVLREFGGDARKVFTLIHMHTLVKTQPKQSKQSTQTKHEETDRVTFSRDVFVTPMEAAHAILSGNVTAPDHGAGLYQTDRMLVPLLVQENYLDCFRTSTVSAMEGASLVSDVLAVCDTMEHVYITPPVEFMVTCGVASLLPPRGLAGKRPKFPAFLGKKSTQNSRRLLGRQLANEMRQCPEMRLDGGNKDVMPFHGVIGGGVADKTLKDYAKARAKSLAC